MTAIQIKYLEYLENKRKNLAGEKLTAEQIQVERNKLAETIANNLRNYHVNVDKNEIQRLYNDQLDSRERQKLAETIRNNVTKETQAMLEYLENQRSHLKNEQIKEKEVEISQNKMLIEALTRNAKDPASALTNWIAGSQALKQVGINVDTTAGLSDLIKTITSSVGADGQYTPLSPYTGSIAQQRDIAEGTQNSWKPQGKDLDPYIPAGGTGRHGNSNAYLKEAYEKAENERLRKEANEVPTDFSSSRGPASQIVSQPTPSIVFAPGSQPNAPKAQANYVSPASKIPASSGGGSAIIYSPGASKTINYGPGF